MSSVRTIVDGESVKDAEYLMTPLLVTRRISQVSHQCNMAVSVPPGDSCGALGKGKQKDCRSDWNVRRGKWEVRAFYSPPFIPCLFSLSSLDKHPEGSVGTRLMWFLVKQIHTFHYFLYWFGLLWEVSKWMMLYKQTVFLARCVELELVVLCLLLSVFYTNCSLSSWLANSWWVWSLTQTRHTSEHLASCT